MYGQSSLWVRTLMYKKVQLCELRPIPLITETIDKPVTSSDVTIANPYFYYIVYVCTAAI